VLPRLETNGQPVCEQITPSDLQEIIVELYAQDTYLGQFAELTCKNPNLSDEFKFFHLLHYLRKCYEASAKELGDYEQPEHDWSRESFEHTGRFRKSIGRFVLGFAGNFKNY
jgi:hypothetical protein